MAAPLVIFGCLFVAVCSEPHDINLIIRPGKDTAKRSQLNFRVGDNEKMGFSFVHSMNEYETLLLQTPSSVAMTISGPAPTSSVFLETESRNLRHSRQMVAAPGDNAGSTASASIAKSITIAGKFSASGSLVSSPAGDVSVNDVKQWKLIAHDTFHKGSIQGWSRKSTTTSGDNTPVPADDDASSCAKYKFEFSDYFLGAFGAVEVSKKFSLPPHSMVRITGRVHFVDRWLGELVYLSVDGGRRWTQSHEWCTQLFESSCTPGVGPAIDACGDSSFADTLSVPIDISFRHVDPATGDNPSSLTIALGADFNHAGGCTKNEDCVGEITCSNGKCMNTQATWGVDDVKVYVR